MLIGPDFDRPAKELHSAVSQKKLDCSREPTAWGLGWYQAWDFRNVVTLVSYAHDVVARMLASLS